MTNITPKGKKIGYLRLTANTPGHPDQEEAKAQLAELAGVKREPIAEKTAPASVPTDSTNLQRFDRDGIELVINTQTGEAFATQRGYTRMSGLSKQAISKRCSQGVNQSQIKTAEIQTPGGIQGVNLIPARLVFKWAIKDNPDLAEAMGEAGATVYMHQLAGFKVSSTATEPIAQPKPEPQPAPVASQTEPQKIGSSIKATADVIEITRRFLTNVNESLVNGFLLNQLQKFHPEIKTVVDDAHALLAATNTIPELLLNPTEVGKRLGLKPQEVNQLLINHGYQVKNVEKSSKTQPDYLPTEKGKPFSNFTLATGKNKDNSSFQHLKWRESIIDELRDLLSLASV